MNNSHEYHDFIENHIEALKKLKGDLLNQQERMAEQIHVLNELLERLIERRNNFSRLITQKSRR